MNSVITLDNAVMITCISNKRGSINTNASSVDRDYVDAMIIKVILRDTVSMQNDMESNITGSEKEKDIEAYILLSEGCTFILSLSEGIIDTPYRGVDVYYRYHAESDHVNFLVSRVLTLSRDLLWSTDDLIYQIP